MENRGIREYGNMGIWEYGNLGIWYLKVGRNVEVFLWGTKYGYGTVRYGMVCCYVPLTLDSCSSYRALLRTEKMGGRSKLLTNWVLCTPYTCNL